MKRILAGLLLLVAESATAATPSFFARRDYPTMGSWIQVADTNGDKIPDVISMSAYQINVLFGNGNGTFKQGPASSNGTQGAGQFVLADLNGDGNLDIITSGTLSGAEVYGIGVCFGNGNGTFQPAVQYPDQSGPYSLAGGVALGDFDGDGIPDVANAGYTGIWLFKGEGGGVFGSPVLIPLAGSTSEGWIYAADVNGDGKPDLVTSSNSGFAVLLGNGDGTFQAPVYYTGPRLSFLGIGALTPGGLPDVVLSSQSSPTNVYLYLNSGSGAFSGPVSVDLPGATASDVTIGDVNGDGIPDLVNGYGYVAFGNGKGKFKPPVHYPTNSGLFGPHNPVLADLRNNGLTDIVVQGATAVSVLLAEGKGKFVDGTWTPVAGGVMGCAVPGDFGPASQPDLALLTTGGIQVLLGTGKGSAPFNTGQSIALSNTVCYMASGDLNGDGIPDLLVITYNSPSSASGAMNAYLGNGDGTFTFKSSTPLSAIGMFALGDFNHDGKPDFITNTNLLAYGNGDGTFQTPVPYLTGPPVCGFEGIAAGDLNNDGWSDLVIACYDTNSIYTYVNNQKGGFNLNATISTSFYQPDWVTLADLNGDGKLDAVVVTYGAQWAFIYLGDGKGGLTLSQQLTYASPWGVANVADVNGDGIPDIELLESDNVGIYLGKGDGTFKTPFYVGTGPQPGIALTEDLHGQSPSAGLPDIVVPDGSGGVTVLINKTK